MRFPNGIFSLFLIFSFSYAIRDTCPIGCRCEEPTQQVICEGQQVVTLPDRLPSGFEILIVRNSSIRAIEKSSFRKMEKLVQIEFENNPNLGTIEKLAFKGLRKIRLIKFSTCHGLTELPKNAFSGIQNQKGLKIVFENTPIHRIDGQAFRNAQNIRELTVSGQELALSRHCFANINQLLIENTRIPSIAPDAFSGLATIQVIELHACQLGTISARAFANVENLGELKILRNTIGDLDTSEAIMSKAIKTRVEENTLECNCGMKWMTSIEMMTKTEGKVNLTLNQQFAIARGREKGRTLRQLAEQFHVHRSTIGKFLKRWRAQNGQPVK
uniref:Uncharacterized protein n=1 Tax=Caenorhabditis japonica TaxID=281687 RepID=A0A8R1DWX9_CAEJA